MANPYAPGAGTEPYRLPGRAEAQVWWRRCLTDLEGLGHTPLRGRVFTGVRGVGKTALLRHFEREAAKRRFGVVAVQAGGADPVRDYLSDALTRLADEDPSFTEKHGRITEVGIKAGPVELAAARDLPDEKPSGPVETAFLRPGRQHRADLRRPGDRGDPAGRRGAGLRPAVADQSVPDRPPAAQTGLPAGAGRAAGTGGRRRRGDHPLRPALRVPRARQPGSRRHPGGAARAGRRARVRWTDEAVAYVAELTDGYPSFVQEYGYAVWESLGRQTLVDIDVARAGVTQARLNVARQYRSVWRSVTPAGRDYLHAVAGLGGEAKTADVAAAMGRRPSELTMTLKMLKDRGALRSPAARLGGSVPPGDGGVDPRRAQLIVQIAIERAGRRPVGRLRPAPRRLAPAPPGGRAGSVHRRGGQGDPAGAGGGLSTTIVPARRALARRVGGSARAVAGDPGLRGQRDVGRGGHRLPRPPGRAGFAAPRRAARARRSC